MNRFKTFVLSAAIAACLTSAAAQAPLEYYDSCEGLCGQPLLEALEAIISDHSSVGYGGLYSLFAVSDSRPDDGSIWDIYSTKRWRADETCGNYQAIGDCYNREHSFPKSWFGGKVEPMYSDAYHLYPTDGKINSYRANYPYGECAGGTTWRNGDITGLGRLGESTTPGYNGTVFEPDDLYKGDLARSYFYMVTCYNSLVDDWDSPMLDGSTYPAWAGWAANMLLKWHRTDPVSEKEKSRNESIYARQHNRNPFIDHPELAEHIWGTLADKPWHISGGNEPRITSPADGTAVDLGLTAVGRALESTVSLKAANIGAPVAASTDNESFVCTPASVSPETAIAGTTITVRYLAGAPGRHSATLRLRSGNAETAVTLTAETQAGIPLYDAAEVTDRSFVIRWVDVDAPGTDYTVELETADGNADGYPRHVRSSDGSLEAVGLEPDTDYIFSVSSPTATSRTATVRTAKPSPDVSIYTDAPVTLRTTEGTPSQPAEVHIMTENIECDLTATVSEPFEISTDCTSWGQTTTLSPDDTRFYVRLGTGNAGSYNASMTVTAGSYVFDDEISVSGTIGKGKTFVETFEAPTTLTGYGSGDYAGSAAAWHVESANIWADDIKFNGTSSMRFRNTGMLVMAEDKPDGIGTLSFDIRRWASKDPDLTVAADCSTDRGATWQRAGQATLAKGTEGFTQLSFEINRPDAARIRIVQLAGERYNIDNVRLTDHTASSPLIGSDRYSWDAHSSEGGLTVDVRGHSRTVTVYGIDGTMRHRLSAMPGKTFIELPKGIYIVVSGEFSRRVALR